MTYMISFVVFLAFVLLMAIGVMFKRQAIQGSCGGITRIGIKKECNCVEVCDEHQHALYQIQEPKC